MRGGEETKIKKERTKEIRMRRRRERRRMRVRSRGNKRRWANNREERKRGA